MASMSSMPSAPMMMNPNVGQHPGAGGRPHLYVGGLSPRVTEHMLGEIFAVAGPVMGVKLIPDRNFQHSGMNYGFVEYYTIQAAENALQILNGRKVFESEIKVNWAYQNATQKEDLSSHFHVFVGDLSPEISDATLTKAFAAFGSLSDARVMWDLNTGKSRGYGFLAFRERADAEQAINAMNGEWLGSKAIRVNWANQRTGGYGGLEPGTGAAGGPVRISNLPPFLGPPAGSTNDDEPSNPPPGRPTGPAANAPPGMQGMPSRPLTNYVPSKPLNYEVVLQQSPPWNTTVYVGNLVPYTTADDLRPRFQAFGYVQEIRIHGDRGFAFVKLDTHQNAAQAIVNVNATEVHGKPVKCSWGREKFGSDTEVIANQANGVTSPPLSGSASLAGYQGWPYGGPALGAPPAGAISPSLQTYYSQYYGNNASINGQNGVSA